MANLFNVCTNCCTEDPFFALTGSADSSAGSSVRERKSAEEVEATVRAWIGHLHPRVASAMERDMVRDILEQIATNIDRNGYDPILQKSKCVNWYGTFFEDSPIIHHQKGKVSQPIFVNRMLAFLFIDNESFAKLQRLPKDAFPMSCRNKKCVALGHIDCSYVQR